ncbi:MAG: hypothetical protein IKO10_11135 [Lachnospiraceae bacterium]|nr:hypothetical protein [Lachnospiraceae bacterium]
MEKEYLKTIYKNSIVFDGFEYFMAYNENGLCKRKPGDNKAEKIRFIEGYNANEINLFSKVELYKDSIIMIPAKAHHVVFYNITKDEEYRVDLYDYLPECSGIDYYFETAFIINDYLYMIGCFYPGMIKIDLKTRSVSVIDINESICSCVPIDVLKNGLCYKGIIKDDHIWMPCMSAPYIFKLDTVTDEITSIKLSTKVSGFNSILIDADKAFLTGRGPVSGYLVEFEMNNCNSTDLYIPVEGELNNPFGDIRKVENKYYLLPESADNVFCFEPGKDIRGVDVLKSVFTEGRSFTVGCRAEDDNLSFFTTDNNILWRFDVNYIQVYQSEIELTSSDAVQREEIKALMNSNQIISEGRYSLNNYISAICC